MRISLLLLTISLNLIGRAEDSLKTGIIIDSIGNEVLLITESELPVRFTSDVFTPVCADSLCYPIRISLNWNLNGTFKNFTLIKGEILTKLDHEPFKEEDYKDLLLILLNDGSALANFQIDELTKGAKSQVDGTTGATVTELQNEFVPGALFTSYTLWHLVRNASAEMRKYAMGLLRDERVFAFVLNHQELGGQDVALDFLLAEEPEKRSTEILRPIIDSTDNELTVLSLEKIRAAEYVEPSTQRLFADTYISTKRKSVKQALLMIWSNRQISDVEQEAVSSELGFEFSTFIDEVTLLDLQQKWSEQTYFNVYEKWKGTNNLIRKGKIEKILERREEQYPKKFRKYLKKQS